MTCSPKWWFKKEAILPAWREERLGNKPSAPGSVSWPVGKDATTLEGLEWGVGLQSACPGTLYPGTTLYWAQLGSLECFEVRQPGTHRQDLVMDRCLASLCGSGGGVAGNKGSG